MGIKKNQPLKVRAGIAGAALLAALGISVSAPGQAIEEFDIPTIGSGPFGITAGADGNLWFAEATAGKIGRIAPDGAIAEFALPDPESQPVQIASGPDGNLWFTEYTAGRIGRITPGGQIDEFPIPTPDSHPKGIVAGPDGNLWFAEEGADRIGRITSTGVFTEYLLPAGSRGPNLIAVGPDDRLWFTEFYSYKIGRVAVSGLMDEVALDSLNRNPHGITTGPDGNAWLTEIPGSGGSLVARVLPDDTFADYSAGVYTAWEIVSGSDGNLWYTESDGKIGRVTLAGQVTRFPVPTTGSFPQGIASGPDGNIWFTENGANKIGRLTPAASPPPTPDFSLIVSPASRSVLPGGTTTASILTSVAGGFNAALSLSASGLPAGTTATFSPATVPAPGSGTAAMTITVGAQTPPGSYSLTITASGGGLTHTANFGLTVSSPAGGSCTPDDTTLCLNGGRFQVKVVWQDFQGNTGDGHVVALAGTADSGLFWFFGPANWELLIKVLNGCGVNGRVWVFAAASTDVAYTITVTDSQTGEQRQYTNPLGSAASAVTDTAAFASCP
jgi:streptogramin lyase